MKKRNTKYILVIILLLVSIGYAFLSVKLQINGSVGMGDVTWDIYFDDPVVSPGSVVDTLPDITQDVDDPSNTKLTWDVDFDLPGEYYEFTVYAVNNSSFDVMITDIDKEVSPVLPNYIRYKVTYIDGTEPSIGDVLLKKTDGVPTKVKYKVGLYFDRNIITAEDVNSITQKIKYNFSLGIDYGIADENAYYGFTFGDEVKYNPVTNSLCTSGTNCYSWNVVDVYDATLKENITLQMDHSFSGLVDWVSKADYNNNSAYGTYGRNDKGPITALKRLETLTSGWNDALKVNYVYDTRKSANNYGVLTCVNGVCDINGNQVTSNLKARLITGEEIADLTIAVGAEKNTPAYKWTLASSNETDWFFFSRDEYKLGTNELLPSGQTSTKRLKWLVANTVANSHSGATGNDSEAGGYWTLSPVSTNVTHAWSVGGSPYEPYNGNLGAYYVKNYASYRIRPVITVQKSVLEN